MNIEQQTARLQAAIAALSDKDFGDPKAQIEHHVSVDGAKFAGWLWYSVEGLPKCETVDTVEHWGHVFHATPGGIAALERWLEQHTILTKIEPHKEANTYERNASYGMF